MADSKGMEAATPAVMSRREAIIGALALAAGTLIAAKPEAAHAANGQSVTTGGIFYTSAETIVYLTSNATDTGNMVSGAMLNRNGFMGGPNQAVAGSVYSSAPAGSAGVWGKAWGSAQIGVQAANSVAGATALKVEGKVELSRSGRATVSKRHSTRTVTVASGIDAAALILVTLQSSPGSGVYLKYAKRTSATTFKVYLNKAATSTVTFAWMIVG